MDQIVLLLESLLDLYQLRLNHLDLYLSFIMLNTFLRYQPQALKEISSLLLFFLILIFFGRTSHLLHRCLISFDHVHLFSLFSSLLHLFFVNIFPVLFIDQLVGLVELVVTEEVDPGLLVVLGVSLCTLGRQIVAGLPVELVDQKQSSYEGEDHAVDHQAN